MKPPRRLHDASIVLIGIRGTGRSTLAILAAKALDFQLVDVDSIIRNRAGVTEQAQIAKYGQEACRNQQVEAVKFALKNHPTRSVIVCGLSAVLEPVQELLLEFRARHPVIYVMRDAKDIAAYLQHGDTTFISAVITSADSVFRKLSNFEFYNLKDTAFAGDIRSANVTRPPSSLILKKAERDFLQLITSVGTSSSIRTRQPRTLASLAPLELRPHTYSLVIPISQVFNLAEQLHEIDTMADAVELVVDVANLQDEEGLLKTTTATLISKAFYIVQRTLSLPIMFHTQMDFGCSLGLPSPKSSSTSLYMAIVQHGLRLCPDYLTVDLHMSQSDIQSVKDNAHRTKLIGHFYEMSPEPNSWDTQSRKNLLQQAGDLGCDLLRICQQATSRADNVSVQRFIRYAEESNHNRIPLIAYNTGSMGRMSVLLNRILTPVTHAHIRLQGHPQNDTTSWIPEVPEALEALYSASRMDALVFGIFGANVHSSLSPYMHNAAFAFCGMPHLYRTFQSASLKEIALILHDQTFGGASITHPFKSDIIALLDSLSPAARAIGAVNTVLPLRSREAHALLNREKRGRVIALYGENTDWIGIHTCIHRNLSPVNAIKGRTVGLVLGAGGMARAAIYSLVYLNVVEIYIWNRTQANAENAAARFSGKVFSLRSDLEQSAEQGEKQTFGPSKITVISSMEEPWPTPRLLPNVIVSCIPNPTFTLPESWLSSRTGGVLIELAYTPLETPLLSQAQSLADRGWIAVNGLQVLPEQGISQFELFTGRKAPRNLMRREMQTRYSERRHGTSK